MMPPFRSELAVVLLILTEKVVTFVLDEYPIMPPQSSPPEMEVASTFAFVSVIPTAVPIMPPHPFPPEMEVTLTLTFVSVELIACPAKTPVSCPPLIVVP